MNIPNLPTRVPEATYDHDTGVTTVRTVTLPLRDAVRTLMTCSPHPDVNRAILDLERRMVGRYGQRAWNRFVSRAVARSGVSWNPESSFNEQAVRL